jgi:hypothetical protein
MIVLLAEVEISDQRGTGEPVIAGVFDDVSALGNARAAFERRHSTRRVWFREIDLGLNEIAPITKRERELGGR